MVGRYIFYNGYTVRQKAYDLCVVRESFVRTELDRANPEHISANI